MATSSSLYPPAPAIGTNNFLFRVLKEAGQVRRTCSTHMAPLTSVTDAQADSRYSSANATREHYIKSVPESVRVAVELLDHLLKSNAGTTEKAN
jgi:hypothetical protein